MQIALPVPDHSTSFDAFATAWEAELAGRASAEVVDSTGVKVYGEGKWKVRQNGWSYRRTWREPPFCVDEERPRDYQCLREHQ